MIRFKLPLFWKFTISIVLIVIVFGSINSIVIYKNVQTSLQNETEKRGLFIAESISKQLTSPFLFEDYLTMQNIINDVKVIDKSIDYIFITDGKGKVLVHTFENELPEKLKSANMIREEEPTHSQIFTIEGPENKIILDIATAIVNSKIGIVRIGLIESTIMQDVRTTVKTFWVMVGLFLIMGIFGALIFANFINKPIKIIQYAVENLDLEHLERHELRRIKIREKLFNKVRMLFRAEDEIDILADKFNEMLFRLQSTYNELQQSQSNLIQSEKLATIGTLTAGLAHEINNPVAGLKNCLRRIIDNPKNMVQNEKYFVMMEKAVEKIENVVSNLLNFTRKQSSDMSNISITETIDNSLLFVSHRLEKLRTVITKNISQDKVFVKGNKNQLEQVFLNLIINSLDSIEAKLKTTPGSKSSLTFKTNVERNNIFIKITDTGEGINSELIDRVFDPFFTTKIQGRGTGLGLSIVYNIIKTHNGSIHVESEIGEGTTVTLVLPVNEVIV